MEEQKSNGGLVGVIIVVIILIAGAWYMWRSREKAVVPPTDEIATEETSIANLNTQGSSDEIGDIEADLNATSLDALNTTVTADTVE